MNRIFRLALGLLVLVMPCLGESAKGPPQTYRWVDEEGVTHYADQVPPEEIKHRRSRLDAEGREISVIEAAKTADQLRREQQLKQLRAEEEKLLAAQRDQDLSLLRSYRSEDEMYRALKNKLDTLDSTIKITESNRQRQQNMLEGQQERAAELEREGQPIPQSLRDLIAATRKQIAEFNEKIKSINTDKQTLTERFAKDIARYRVIATRPKHMNESLAAGLSAATDKNGTDEIVISAIACAVGTVCDRAWELAKSYVLKHGGPTLSLETERILQTPAPATDGEFSMTVTRIYSKAEHILFLDIRCRSSSVGEALCSSPNVRAIRTGFKSYIETGLAAADGASDSAPNGDSH